jgi:cytochrome c-type biogenesis protein
LSVIFWFGLSFGIPLLAVSLLSGTLQRQITRQFAIHAQKINLIGGVLLLSIGLFNLWVNWQSISASLGAG